MKQHFHTHTIPTHGARLYEFTDAAQTFIAKSGIRDGLLTCFIRHTSASLLIQENADPNVQKDLIAAFSRLAPEAFPYAHDEEGPDDMPSHIKSALTAVSLSVPVRGGRLALGTWQGLYLFEHRSIAHRREVLLHGIGE
ncbi:MAG: YjbQ family protein [Alphaproteobacteria bacterium]|nr:YjbQ family protein [Alphaproteobacteria bacterium]